MSDLKDSVDKVTEKLDEALAKMKEAGQGRVYYVGKKVLYGGKLGVVTMLNKWSTDPGGHTINITTEDGAEYNNIPIDSPKLEYFRT